MTNPTEEMLRVINAECRHQIELRARGGKAA